MRIVGEQGPVERDRVEGRIEFRGPSAMEGYFHNEEATAAVRRGDGWIDTGDLGYWADGDLFVTGRVKDVIIAGGRNIYPQEVEEAVGDVSGVRRGCVAAFGVRDAATGTERLVIVAESRETTAAAKATIVGGRYGGGRRRHLRFRRTSSSSRGRAAFPRPRAARSAAIRRAISTSRARSSAGGRRRRRSGRGSIARDVGWRCRERASRTRAALLFTGWAWLLVVLLVPLLWIALTLARGRRAARRVVSVLRAHCFCVSAGAGSTSPAPASPG